MKTIVIKAHNTTREFAASDLDTTCSILAHTDVRHLFGFEDGDQDAAQSTLLDHVSEIQNGAENYSVENMSEGFKKAVLNAVLEDGATITINYYAVENDQGEPVDRGEVDRNGNYAGPVADNNGPQPEQAEDPAEEDDGFDDDDDEEDPFEDDDEDGVEDDEEDNDVGDPEPEAAQTTAGEPRHGIVKVNTNGGMIETKVEIIDGVTTLQEAIYSEPVKARSAMDETAISNCSVILNGDTISPNNIGTRKLKSGDTIDLTPRFAAVKG